MAVREVDVVLSERDPDAHGCQFVVGGDFVVDVVVVDLVVVVVRDVVVAGFVVVVVDFVVVGRSVVVVS